MTKTSRPCPICKKPRNEDFAPFCSSHCKDRDLARWFDDGYAVPGRPANPDEIAGEIIGEERD
ncbi:DNA gyrase inhibitor YacG [Altererythrobacter sp.]|nr:DNA gyrase inhibitor YacG [Altererythrobacter sp.]MBO6609806.1 DNA gyrase inhibitor YacG [Altererythrobacter sp.]MBO6640992.1 DNA gyrase inhibitor YacG [Altererythrobacter sp.]MBO6708310.1 DNA gyrase inhibitor YacG [Altererythrobacter sp.]MBO6945554.1 DNA gyrase inhibitor YacG [Altererythrobacter sp.]